MATSKKTAKKAKKVAKKATKKPAKKAVKKTSQTKVVKKSSKTVKKAVKKTSAKKKVSRSQKKDRDVRVCSACHSPYLRSDMVGDKLIYTCLRCGYRSPDARTAKYSEVKNVLDKRREEIKAAHVQRRIPHVKTMRHYMHHFPVRLWFGLIGMIFFVIGIILITSPERLAAGVLLVLGAIMAYMGEKL